MASSTNVYANAIDQAFGGTINWASHTIKLGLVSASYTPNLSTDTFWSTPAAFEITGTGYTAGGATLGTKTHTVTAANSYALSNDLFTTGIWIASTAVANVGDVVKPTVGNGFLYKSTTTGTTSGTQPTWPTVVGATVVDNSVTWVCEGESINIFSSAAASWSTATISAAQGVIYDANTGVSTTEPLIAYVSFGSTIASTASTYTITPTSLGWFWLSAA